MRNFLAMLGLAVCVFAGPAGAQEFPSKPVKLVIPFPAGAGANDVLGRFVADKLSKLWGQPVIVENKPGANATLGAMAVVRAEPDGYTLLFNSANYAMTPAMVAMPFDARRDLKPVGLVGTGEYLLVSGGHVKAGNVKEFAAETKTREFSYVGGTPGADLPAALFMEATGAKMKRVPYGGNNDALMDLFGGRVDFMVAAVGSQVGNIKEGKVKALAVTGPNRSNQLPDVPTMRELGFPGGEVPAWWVILAPTATPKPVVDKINASLDKVLADGETEAFFEKQSAVPANMKPDKIEAMLSESITKFKTVAEKNGLGVK